MEKQRKNLLILIFFSLISMALALLIARAVDLQAFQGEFFANISQRNRKFRVELPAERGIISDRFGDPLVINQRSYFKVLDPTALYSKQEALSKEQALALEIEDPFQVNYVLQRVYLRPFSLAHSLGYVSGVTADDLEENHQLEMSDVLGRVGLEAFFDESLRGTVGYREFEINALGEKRSEAFRVEPKLGRSVQSSLDPYLSTVAWKAMGNKTGAVVILYADTGKILSLISTPSFNNNLFTPTYQPDEKQLKTAELNTALADEKKLFFNRAISGLYAPGSIFKLVTAIAGLEANAFTTETTVDDQGVLDVGEYRYANWYYTQYGRTEGLISLVRAIARSNDTYFYKAAELVGVDALAQQAEELGFGKKTGVELPGEKSGLVPNPTWKEKNIGERWFLGNTFHMGIGQGDLLVTPLQQAQLVQVFGNGGKLCKPSLIENNGQSTCSSIGVKDENLAAVQEGMIQACSPGGVAFPFFPWNQQHLAQLSAETVSPQQQINNGVIACKTGTAEFGAADQRGYRKTHAWFGMTVGGVKKMLEEQTKVLGENTALQSPTIDENSEAERDLSVEKAKWLVLLKKNSFPNTIAIVVLVESDEVQPYQEGSRDAAPVALEIWNWMMGLE